VWGIKSSCRHKTVEGASVWSDWGDGALKQNKKRAKNVIIENEGAPKGMREPQSGEYVHFGM